MSELIVARIRCAEASRCREIPDTPQSKTGRRFP